MCWKMNEVNPGIFSFQKQPPVSAQTVYFNEHLIPGQAGASKGQVFK